MAEASRFGRDRGRVTRMKKATNSDEVFMARTPEKDPTARAQAAPRRSERGIVNDDPNPRV
jgi:hypothetical protein